MRRKPTFHTPIRLETEYHNAITRYMNEWLNAPALETLDGILDVLHRFGKDHELIEPEIMRIARNMVTAVASGNWKDWRQAARHSTQGRRIYQGLLRDMRGPLGAEVAHHVRQNADLIRSIPRELAAETTAYVQQRQMMGERADVIAQALRKRLPRATKAKIAVISRTEVAKAATALTRARADRMGFGWYEWDTSEDGRVRKSHRNMDLVLVAWADPPAPEALIGEDSRLGHYHPGNAPNCRCDANVLVDLDQVSWPHKVYTGGRIQRMGKLAFQKIM